MAGGLPGDSVDMYNLIKLQSHPLRAVTTPVSAETEGCGCSLLRRLLSAPRRHVTCPMMMIVPIGG